MNKLTESDHQFLDKAILLATIPMGLVSPNPYVGAVIVKDGKIIGEGFHAKAGTAHAEVVAIQNAKNNHESTVGATIYVSLEPCCHHGKTGPCTEAILNAGITKVVYATQDPNPSVAGKGEAFLVANGIEAICADLKSACQINKIFFHNQIKKTPFVTLKAAMSLDGKIASKSGDSQWITGIEARLKGHQLRAEHDAILIGKKTLLNDDPCLTVRLPNQNYPNSIRVLLLRNFSGIEHTNYQLFNTDIAPTWIIYPKNQIIDTALKTELLAKNVHLIELQDDEIIVDSVLTKLYEEKVMSVLLEGGSSIYNAFITAQKVNEFALFYGPRLIGDAKAPSLWDHSNITDLSEAPILSIHATEKLGNSIYVRATLKEVE
ncbi:MAG: bifunctional diaminohydroxyphosphoribosylaminopyrimidine deaminase/5-amino-6-(5-phosphoribosylamino)uracil reductase RibD [Wohlfahrtiimonas sp.]